jgi:AcrR family transcriptional regulator
MPTPATTAPPARLAALHLRRVPQQARSARRVEAIERAAARLVARDGWYAVSAHQIAEQAGVPVGTLYQFFDDKEAIGARLVSAWADACLRGVDALTRAAPAPLDWPVALLTLLHELDAAHPAVRRLRRLDDAGLRRRLGLDEPMARLGAAVARLLRRREGLDARTASRRAVIALPLLLDPPDRRLRALRRDWQALVHLALGVHRARRSGAPT